MRTPTVTPVVRRLLRGGLLTGLAVVFGLGGGAGIAEASGHHRSGTHATRTRASHKASGKAHTGRHASHSGHSSHSRAHAAGGQKPASRSSAARREFMRRSGYPRGRRGYVVDHIRPLACGGADTPDNMQWQTVAEAKAKDQTERAGCE